MTNHVPIDFYRLKLTKSKLKAVTRTSALLSGFAMVAMVEFNLDIGSVDDQNSKTSLTMSPAEVVFNKSAINDSSLSEFKPVGTSKMPQSILIIYSCVTCLLVGIHMLALMISTCILPQVEALSLEQSESSSYNNHNVDHPNDDSLRNQNIDSNLNRRNMDHSTNSLHGHTSNHQTIVYPYIQYHRFIELSWISSTVIGIFLFLVEIGLVCYIKFYPISFVAAMAGIVVMIPICVLFVVFTWLVSHSTLI